MIQDDRLRSSRFASAAYRWGAIATLISALALPAACAAHPARETSRMSSSATHDSMPPSQITATQALNGVMALIRSHKTVTELTPESMGQALGVPVTRVSADHYGYAQRLPGDWSFSVQRQLVPSIGPRVDLAFSPVDEAEPSPQGICSPDFAHFTAELEQLGFTRQTSRGEHGRWNFDAFDRPGQHVEVYPLVQPGDGPGKDLTCIKMVLIR
ncbi:hypothetical protein [Luteibacter sp. 9135]|uniref:hypothetical protein n=1 Tax=Luteibacter sp. 9135 TaxID=1500893 RepID=UPI001C838C0C|nr:hypothetical protein [Luteibacter sp. 9135]